MSTETPIAHTQNNFPINSNIIVLLTRVNELKEILASFTPEDLQCKEAQKTIQYAEGLLTLIGI